MIRKPTLEPIMPKRIDLTGQTFNRLTVIGYAGPDTTGRATWHCRCACGGEKIAKAHELKRGNTASCGCLAQEQRQAAAQSRCHDYSRANWPCEYRSWESMLARCTDSRNPGYANYGGRGITVCDRWMASFRSFAEDMGPAPSGGSIERTDNNQGYSPENCRWATRKEQANNRRTNRLLTWQGKTQTVSQWAEELGLVRQRIYHQLRAGIAIECILGQAG